MKPKVIQMPWSCIQNEVSEYLLTGIKLKQP